MRKEISKYFLSLSQIIIGGLVLSEIMTVSENSLLTLFSGLFLAVVSALIGFRMLNSKKKRK